MLYLNRIQISARIKTVYLAFLMTLGSVLCMAQQDSLPDSYVKTKRLRLSVGFNLGAVSNVKKNTTPEDYTSYWLSNFRAIAPNSKYVHDDFSNCDTMTRSSNANFNANIFVSRPVKTVKCFDIELKGNLMVNTKARESLSFISKDTLSWAHYNFEFKGSNIGIEISPMFYFNKLKTLYPYIGISAGIACSYNNRLITKYNPNGRLTDRGEWMMVPLNKNTSVETTRLKSTTSYYFSVPFGLSLKRKTKPTYISPFIDFRYGIKLEKYPTAHYRVVHAIYWQIGFKVNFYK